MARFIDNKLKEGFAYEAAKISVITGKPVEEVYEALINNYNKALDYDEEKQKTVSYSLK